MYFIVDCLWPCLGTWYIPSIKPFSLEDFFQPIQFHTIPELHSFARALVHEQRIKWSGMWTKLSLPCWKPGGAHLVSYPLRLKVSSIDYALTVASVMLDCNVKKFMTPLKKVKHLVGWLDMIFICAR